MMKECRSEKRKKPKIKQNSFRTNSFVAVFLYFRRLCSFLIYIWCAAAAATPTALMEILSTDFMHMKNKTRRCVVWLIVIVVAALQIENTQFGFPFSQ